LSDRVASDYRALSGIDSRSTRAWDEMTRTERTVERWRTGGEGEVRDYHFSGHRRPFQLNAHSTVSTLELELELKTGVNGIFNSSPEPTAKAV
jgi:hypothetical protein